MTALRRREAHDSSRGANVVTLDAHRTNARPASTARASGSSCLRCEATYDDDDWEDLAFVERLTAARMREIVQSWPEDRLLEVRRCAACNCEVVRRMEG